METFLPHKKSPKSQTCLFISESLFTTNFLTDEGILSRKEGRRMGHEERWKRYEGKGGNEEGGRVNEQGNAKFLQKILCSISQKQYSLMLHTAFPQGPQC